MVDGGDGARAVLCDAPLNDHFPKAAKTNFLVARSSSVIARRKVHCSILVAQTHFEGGQTKTLSLQLDHPSRGADLHPQRMQNENVLTCSDVLNYRRVGIRHKNM